MDAVVERGQRDRVRRVGVRRVGIGALGGLIATSVAVLVVGGMGVTPASASLGTPTTYTNSTQATASYNDYVVPAGATSVLVTLQGKSGEDVTPTGPPPNIVSHDRGRINGPWLRNR